MFSSLTWAIINAKTGSNVIFTPVMHSRRAIDKVLLTIKIMNALRILILILNRLNYSKAITYCIYLYKTVNVKNGITRISR